MISVVMTTYNGESFVREQIESIFQQTLLPDELIIIDDCSTDRTVDVVKKTVLSAPESVRVNVISNQTNVGYIENFYNAISKAKGSYIFLSDQDDVWEKEKIDEMIRVMKQEKCSLLCSNFHLIDKSGNIVEDRDSYNINEFIEKIKADYKEISLHRLIYGNVAQGCTYCFTREIQDKYIRLHCNYVIHDKQLIIIAASIGKVGFLNRKLIRYRIHGANSVGISSKKTKAYMKHKGIRKKPVMVQFLEDLSNEIYVPNCSYYKMLYYLRIPYFAFLLRRSIRG